MSNTRVSLQQTIDFIQEEINGLEARISELLSAQKVLMGIFNHGKVNGTQRALPPVPILPEQRVKKPPKEKRHYNTRQEPRPGYTTSGSKILKEWTDERGHHFMTVQSIRGNIRTIDRTASVSGIRKAARERREAKEAEAAQQPTRQPTPGVKLIKQPQHHFSFAELDAPPAGVALIKKDVSEAIPATAR